MISLPAGTAPSRATDFHAHATSLQTRHPSGLFLVRRLIRGPTDAARRAFVPWLLGDPPPQHERVETPRDLQQARLPPLGMVPVAPASRSTSSVMDPRDPRRPRRR